MPRPGFIVLAACVVLLAAVPRGRAEQVKGQEVRASYVGSQNCQSCHPEIYARFKKYSKMARSYKHVRLLKKGLTEQEYHHCLKCHTTGYGKPGGFSSEKETPQLAQVGCEDCHGPGSIHVATADPKNIRTVSEKGCKACHNSERVGAFRFRPMIYGGAH